LIENEPQIGAVAIPYIEPKRANKILQSAPDNTTIWVTCHFIGTAHLLRRDKFLELGGYREDFVHQREESEYCLRIMDQGFFIALGRGDSIIHHESPRRDYSRMDYYGAKNLIKIVWSQVPMPYLPVHLIASILNTVGFAVRIRRPKQLLRGLANGLASIVSDHSMRNPVKPSTYRLYRQLIKGAPMSLADAKTTFSNKS
jgi:hypothetical protein